MSNSLRLTQSGACASCGAYGGSQHRPTCQPDVPRKFKRPHSRRAKVDARMSAAMRDRTRFEDEVIARL